MANQQFDVFLCHNSEDKPAVIEIAQQLQQNDLTPWLDVWELRPGSIWQFVFEQQIENIWAAAVFVGQQGLGPWQEQEIYAFLQEFMRRRCPVIPVLLPDAPQQPRLPIFLKNCHWVDFRLQNPEPLSQLIWGITGTKPTVLSSTAAVIEPADVANNVAPKTDPQAELAALQAELERLKVQQAAVPSAEKTQTEIELKSEKGIDYRRLRDLLKAGQWRSADEETVYRMLEAVGRSHDDWIPPDELQNFPCADLKTIDALWTVHSRGKFGFSVQIEIWQECGSPNDVGKDWDRFCAKVGWQDATASRYISYDDLKADPNFSPIGEFPLCGMACLWGLVGWHGWLCCCVSSLASRLVNCSK